MGRNRRAILLVVMAIVLTGVSASRAHAASAAKINKEVNEALKKLYASNPTAKAVAAQAKAVLVFPSIWKAGFIIGGQGGNGALRKGGKTVAYYNSAAASYGLQAGAQGFGYALFFMTDSALDYLDKHDGWEIGTGPSIVFIDAGVAKSITSGTFTDDIYAIIFDQKGLMAGIGIQGSKLTRIHPGK
ncbi:MAG: twin-arginine translocation pathway signal protein [Candidatus Binatia bacterium]